MITPTHNEEESAQWIIDFAERKQERRSHIVLDDDGVCGGMVDKVSCVGFVNNSAAIQPRKAKADSLKKLNYANLKTQCAFELVLLAELFDMAMIRAFFEVKPRGGFLWWRCRVKSILNNY